VTSSSGVVRILKDLDRDIAGRPVPVGDRPGQQLASGDNAGHGEAVLLRRGVETAPPILDVVAVEPDDQRRGLLVAEDPQRLDGSPRP
jgi:hypothetical protein